MGFGRFKELILGERGFQVDEKTEDELISLGFFGAGISITIALFLSLKKIWLFSRETSRVKPFYFFYHYLFYIYIFSFGEISH